MAISRDPLVRARADYVRGALALMIRHTWDLCHLPHGPAPLFEALDKCVNIYRMTSLYDGRHDPTDPAFRSRDWEGIKAGLRKRFMAHEDKGDVAALEQDALEYLWPLLESRIERDAVPVRKGPDRPFGCWTAHYEGDRVTLDIANAFQPASPFEHMDEFAGDLLNLLEDARARAQRPSAVACRSWLNHFPPFQALFPKTWRDHPGPTERRAADMGIWGQYMDRRGGFHRAHAARYRAARAHPYPCSWASCGIDEAIEHLGQQRWTAG